MKTPTFTKNLLLDVATIVALLFCVVEIAIFISIMYSALNDNFKVRHAQKMVGNNNFTWDIRFNKSPSHKDNQNSLFNIEHKTHYTEGNQKEEDVLALSEMTVISSILYYLQISLILLFTVLSVVAFIKIIRSVKSVNTFARANVSSFRKIGRYLFIVFLLSSITIAFFHQGKFFRFSLEALPLILMMVAFILAEIFEEGNKLREENQLTV